MTNFHLIWRYLILAIIYVVKFTILTVKAFYFGLQTIFGRIALMVFLFTPLPPGSFAEFAGIVRTPIEKMNSDIFVLAFSANLAVGLTDLEGKDISNDNLSTSFSHVLNFYPRGDSKTWNGWDFRPGWLNQIKAKPKHSFKKNQSPLDYKVQSKLFPEVTNLQALTYSAYAGLVLLALISLVDYYYQGYSFHWNKERAIFAFASWLAALMSHLCFTVPYAKALNEGLVPDGLMEEQGRVFIVHCFAYMNMVSTGALPFMMYLGIKKFVQNNFSFSGLSPWKFSTSNNGPQKFSKIFRIGGNKMIALESTKDLSEMEPWRAFEYGVADLLQKKYGYAKTVDELKASGKIKLASYSNDQGADVIVEWKDNQGVPQKMVVQCKHYKDLVGNKAVQEITAAKALYKANIAMIVTTSAFSQPAEELAKANGVYTVNGFGLKQLIDECKRAA